MEVADFHDTSAGYILDGMTLLPVRFDYKRKSEVAIKTGGCKSHDKDQDRRVLLHSAAGANACGGRGIEEDAGEIDAGRVDGADCAAGGADN